MNQPLEKIIQDAQAFENLMQEMDSELKANNIPIPGRSIAAQCAITKKFNCSLSGNSKEAQAINNWFVQTYGDALKINFDIAATVIQIKGDIYRVRLPRILGKVKVNVLEWIEKVTPKLIQSLSKEELDVIGFQIFSHFQAYAKMEKMPSDCTVDLRTSVDHLTNQHPQYGLSRWASLQASEKALKVYIKEKGGKPLTGGKDGHDLSKLAVLAEQRGLPAIDKTLITNAQCSAGVRYPETPSSKQQAIDAYLASVKICEHIAENHPFN